MTVLVIGATGSVGRGVVERLAAGGHQVRATSRDPSRAQVPAGVEVARADLTDPETIAPLLGDVDAAWLYAEPEQAHDVAAVLAAGGAPRVVLLSSSSINGPGAEDSFIAQRHAAVERALTDAGLACTFVRPGSFATNTLRWAPVVKAGGPLRFPFPDSRSSPIHEADIAEVGAIALTRPNLAGTVKVLSGPASLSLADQAESIAAATGAPLTVERITVEEARQEAGGAPPPIVDTLLRYQEMMDGVDADVSPEVEAITGHAPLSFERWVADHRSAFVA